MEELKKSFEKVLFDFNTIDWSETDGRDIREILETYFEDIQNNKMGITKLIEKCNSINKYQKQLTTKILVECC